MRGGRFFFLYFENEVEMPHRMGGKVRTSLKKYIIIGQPGLAWPVVVVVPNVTSFHGAKYLASPLNVTIKFD